MDSRTTTVRQIITFLLITTAFSAALFVWMYGSSASVERTGMLMMWIPGISAVVTSLLFRDDIPKYGWRLGTRKYYGYALMVPILAALVGYGLVWMGGIGDVYVDEVRNYRWARMVGLETPVPVVVGLFSKAVLGFLVALPFVFGEEIGWSGFLTPKLRKISSFHATSLIVGGFWAAWHYPAIIGGFYGHGTPLWIALPGFTLVLIGASYVRTIVVTGSGSLWTGAVLHASHNTFLMGIFFDLTVKEGKVAYFISETGILLGVVYILVALAAHHHLRASGAMNPSLRMPADLHE